MRVISVFLMMFGLTLAGCVGDEASVVDTAEVVDKEVFELEVGKGAIAGLLVDDRFRPIDLEDEPETEFQTTGFILLQETGEQVKTNENGEFTFVDLEPGKYTVRVTADGHEAIPQKVQVTEGVFNEASIVARRIISEGGTIITEQYAAFASCLPNAVVFSFRLECTGDESGDTDRSGFVLDYSTFGDVTWVVAEALFNQDPQNGASFDVTMRDASDTTNTHTAAVLWDTRYATMHLKHGEISSDPVPEGDEFYPWYSNQTFTLEMFGRGYFAEEIRTTYKPVYDAQQGGPCVPTGLGYCLYELPMRRGVGGQLGVEAKFLVSAFIGEPEVDPLSYCALC